MPDRELDLDPRDPRNQLYTPGEVARLYRVAPKTVTRWTATRVFPDKVVVLTPGGHHRFRKIYIDALLRGERVE